MNECRPTECGDIQERLAIMENEGGVRVNLLSKAINSQCTNCAFRGKTPKHHIAEALRKKEAAAGRRV